MATQYYTYELECERCGKLGRAEGKDNDNGPNFEITGVTSGFREGGYSPNPWSQHFSHKCGDGTGSAKVTMVDE